MEPITTSAKDTAYKVPLFQKLIYGSGDWGRASFNTLRQIFYAIFLTDVVGLDARLASIAALIGIIWDAINDPIIGAISDNVRTRWGRRRPFLILFAIPFALAFVLLWWAPPWQSQLLLMVHITLAFMMSDTIQTLITVPYLSLTPEIAQDYDERTSLTTFRMLFNLLASLVTAVAAPMIIDSALKVGMTLQHGYLVVAALFGGIAIIPFVVIFATLKEKPLPPLESVPHITLKETIKILFSNMPFRYATGIYILNWISFDIVALMLPYFLLYWIAQGDLLYQVNLLGIKLPIESAALGILMLTATATLPLWNYVAKRLNKHHAYVIGMMFWIVVQLLILTIKTGDINYILLLAVLAGISVSNAHVIPEAMFPDVIEWDELRNNTRREGMYYGAINFLRKMSSAFAIFISLQILGWFGYVTPPETAEIFQQSNTTLTTIRILIGPFVAVLLIAAISIAWFFPLNRDRQARIRRMLERRQRRLDRKQKKEH